jgi:hypothetical protein
MGSGLRTRVPGAGTTPPEWNVRRRRSLALRGLADSSIQGVVD